MGLRIAGRAGPGPNIHGLGRAGLSRAGLKKLLRAWTLTANCGPGLGSNYRSAQGTNSYIDFMYRCHEGILGRHCLCSAAMINLQCMMCELFRALLHRIKLMFSCSTGLDLSYDGKEQTLTARVSLHWLFCKNAPIFLNQSLGLVGIEGYKLWVRFSGKRSRADVISRISCSMCVNRGETFSRNKNKRYNNRLLEC